MRMAGDVFLGPVVTGAVSDFSRRGDRRNWSAVPCASTGVATESMPLKAVATLATTVHAASLIMTGTSELRIDFTRVRHPVATPSACS